MARAFLSSVILFAMISVANADLILTINGLDVAEPLEIKGKEDLIIAVAGKSEAKAQDISVTADSGKLEPLTEPNAPAEKASYEYLFTFTKEADVSTISLSVDNEIDYQLILFKIPDANTVIFGIDSDAIEIPKPEPETEAELFSAEVDNTESMAGETM